MNIAYLDCFSGVSGNMLLGALIAAGFSEDSLRANLNALHIKGFELEIDKVIQSGLEAVRIQVHVTGTQIHRHLQQIDSILDKSSLSPQILKKSKAVFLRLAQAEAAVHGCLPEQVHFHEVGAVDALVDVVGVVAGLDYLGIDKLVCSSLPMPRGWVECEHGTLPLPAPAVCQLLEKVPVYGESLAQELVTPTGAAIVAELASEFGVMPTMQLSKTGYGAGTMVRNDGRPNLLRIIIGSVSFEEELQRVMVLESNLDDWNPEVWPHVSARFMEKGALDVSLIPLHMKKGRPGYSLRVICDPAHITLMRELIFSETSAIGLRFRTEQRMTLPRKSIFVKTSFGIVQAKEIITDKGPIITPEYEESRRVAIEHGVPLQDVYREIMKGSKNDG